VDRPAIRIHNSAWMLRVDLYDETDDVLYECQVLSPQDSRKLMGKEAIGVS
jgi:hypothetical protein